VCQSVPLWTSLPTEKKRKGDISFFKVPYIIYFELFVIDISETSQFY
jgi:hypothetical protein